MARTRVLLKEPVDNLGVAGDVCVVARGYARNYLIPNNLAVWATVSALKQADEIRQMGLKKLAILQAEANAQAEILAGKRLLFHELAGESNRLYGSVTAMDIEERLLEETALAIDRRKLLLDGPIRQLGVFPVRIRLLQDIETFIEVGVVREGEGWDEAEIYRRLAEVADEKAQAADPMDTELDELAEDEEIRQTLREMDLAVEEAPDADTVEGDGDQDGSP